MDRPDGPAATDIRAAVLSNGGAALATNILVNTTTAGPQDHASVVALADGGFLVSWRSGNAVVEAQRFDALGHKVGVEFTLHGNVANHADAALLSRWPHRVCHRQHFDRRPRRGDLDLEPSVRPPSPPRDFNGDGTTDLLWQNAATGATAEWLMAPNGGCRLARHAAGRRVERGRQRRFQRRRHRRHVVAARRPPARPRNG